MPQKKIQSSTVNLLARLISPRGSRVVVYDPDGRLTADESHHFILEGSATELPRHLGGAETPRTCLFNLSEAPLDVPPAGWLIEFDTSHTYPFTDRRIWNCIDNPDGSPRWLYPSELRKPRFLAFYNFTYWKASLYKFLVKLAFSLHVPALVRDGRIIVHHRRPLHVETLIGGAPDHANDDTISTSAPSQTRNSDYAIFTGTAGPNRKAVIAEGQGSRVHSFLKIALNDRSAENIANEYNSLCLLRHLPVKNLVIPTVSALDKFSIRVNNVKPVSPRLLRQFGPCHWQLLRGLFDVSFDRKNYRQMPISYETGKRLRRLANHPRLSEKGRGRELFDKLVAIEQHLHATDPVVGTTISHGDLTPWNVYSKNNKVFVYDWEFCRQSMPALFDFFHYVIQGKVFSAHPSARGLHAELDNLLSDPVRSRFLLEQGLDAGFYLQLYLLFNGAYYLEVYLEQELLHKEGYRLLSIWSELLGPRHPALPRQQQRKIFIRSFFGFLENKSYTVLKSAGKSMQNLSRESDLDLLLAKADLPSTIDWIKSYPGVEKLRYTRRSFMITVQLYFTDQSFLSIDILHAFHRKGLEYIPAAEMLDHTELADGVRILQPAYDYLYIFLFYHLNGASIPAKYSSLFLHSGTETQKAILTLLGSHTGIQAPELCATFAWSAQTQRELIAFLRRSPGNRTLTRIARWLHYMADSLSDLRRAKGMMLSFSGVDGAGKTTILGEMRELLQQKYRRKVVVLRHRPCLLPILSAWKYGKETAEKKIVSSLPRKGNNQNRLSSLFRFAYYYADYLLGQFLVYIKYTLRGYVVLYDRYYFDFIVDGKRSNILLRPSFIRQLYRFVYKPQLNVFLYAAPEVILKRKQELTAGDIRHLTEHYKTLFGRIGTEQHYICIENTDKQATMERIEQAYVLLN
jgi:thymidylate kinase